MTIGHANHPDPEVREAVGAHQANIDAAANLARELAALNDRIAQAQARKAEVEAALRILLPYGAYDAGGARISIEHNVRFDPDKFAKLYPADKHPELYRNVPNPDAVTARFSPLEYPDLYNQVPDSNAIKEHLSKAQLKEVRNEGPAKVILK